MKVYPRFKQIDGSHSLKSAIPGAYIEYRARLRHGGKVFYFNFELAKQMGLINRDHPNSMNDALSDTLLDTFSLVIINEYDRIHRTPIKKEDIKPNRYMATRYLQLQHPSKRGVTSGDGRGIWNGEVKHNGVTWDVASSGTGATRLSPAVALEKKFFKSGDKRVCYGNGYTSLDDTLSAALMSEIFFKNDIPTERCLLIIEFSDGSSIYVRASKNLLRPSHFFSPLKQENLKRLKATVDYFIERQVSNGDWPEIRDHKRRYEYMAKKMALTFSSTAANFESNYIFCWLDWDGDNILANGGIIDYGSVRQFGLYHHEYRYDDVDRFSTKISEQRLKARYITQCFAQIREYIITGTKTNIVKFRKDSSLKIFDKNFAKFLNKDLLYKVGFSDAQTSYLMKYHLRVVTKFKMHYSYFEKTKSKRGVYTVPDGVTCDAIFCMRDGLRELPFKYHKDQKLLDAKDFIDIIRSSYARKKDLKLNASRILRILDFQRSYMELAKKVSAKFHNKKINKTFLELSMRSSIRNPHDRITGNGILFVTDQIIKDKKRLTFDEVHLIINEIIQTQLTAKWDEMRVRHQRLRKKVLQNIQLIRESRESV